MRRRDVLKGLAALPVACTNPLTGEPCDEPDDLEQNWEQDESDASQMRRRREYDRRNHPLGEVEGDDGCAPQAAQMVAFTALVVTLVVRTVQAVRR